MGASARYSARSSRPSTTSWCWARWPSQLVGERLLKPLARLAHERHRFREHCGHDRAQLLGLLLGRALDVGPVHRRHGQIDGELDGVVGPGQALRALHLLGEFAKTALELIWIAEHSAEAAAFHTL